MAVLPEEKLSLEMDEIRTEQSVAVLLAKSDVRNFSVVLTDRSRFNQSPLRDVNYELHCALYNQPLG